MVQNRSIQALRSSAWWSFAFLAFAYVAINFVLTKNVLAPVHQDDYLALGYGFEDMRWSISRPVSTNLIYFMGAMGPGFSFLLLSVMTIAMATLVLRFQQRVFGRDFPLAGLVLFAVIAFAHMASFEHGKLLGLATTLSSNVAGLLALCLLWDAWTRRSWPHAVGGLLAYLVAVFAKEDFILPPLVLLAWFWLQRLVQVKPWRAALTRFEVALTIAVGVVAVGSVAYNFFLSSNPFVSGLSADAARVDPYSVGLSPVVLATSFWRLTFGYAPMASALALGAFVLGALFVPTLRWALLLMAGLVFALMLPYALIPNNMPEFRVYGWLPWYAGVVVVVLLALVDRFGARVPNATRTILGAVLALSIAGATWYQANGYRQSVAGWYAMQETLNARILQSLREHRSEIAREPVVGIVGVEALSPWSNTDAQYLHRKLYFDNKWVVFVPTGTMFFQLDPIVDGKPSTVKKFVTVEETARACLPGRDLLLLSFDAEGNATPIRSGAWCAARAAAH